MSTRAEPDVVVVGGGIGGLSTALALARAGRRVRVLERSAQFGEVGAGLQMAPNATRVLRDWGLLEQVVARGVCPQRLVLRDALDGSELTSLSLRASERRYGAPYVVAHRSDLHEVLLEACRAHQVDLVTSCHVTDVQTGADTATAVSADRRDRARVVVAADGLNSQLRSLLSDDEPVNSAFVAYRGAVPFDAVHDQVGVRPSDMAVYIGPGCHFVQYALRQGQMFNQVAVFRSAGAVRGEAEWGTPEELDAAFADACAPVRSGLPHMWRDRCWRMYDRDPIEGWVRGRMVLTGDAAHPMLQYLAQGACQAIEDAYVLAEQVRKHTGADGRGGERVDWDAALADYQYARVPRTARVQTSARAWGDLWHCDGAQRDARNAMFRARALEDYTYLDWLWLDAG